MSKISPKEENALAVQNVNPLDLIPTAEQMDDGFVEPSTGQFLPFLEMVFPVMISPEAKIYKGHAWELGFKSGQEFVAVGEGWVLTVIDKRNAAKIEILQEDGETKKNHYAYQGIERNGQKFEKTVAEYNELVGREKSADNIFCGYSMLVVAISPEGKAVVLDFSVFKTMTSYMYAALAPCMISRKMGLKLGISNHEDNTTKSKRGYFYPDSKKFKQWEHVQLTKNQFEDIAVALKENSEQLMNWYAR